MNVMKMRFVKEKVQIWQHDFATSKWHAFSLQVKWISELYITLSFNKAFETSRITSENLTDIHYVILEQGFFHLRYHPG